MTKYLSGRVKIRDHTGLTTDRYKYLGLDQAEPNLGNPIGTLPNVPSGTQFQIVAIPSRPGERFWVPIQGGLIPGSISVFDEGTLVGTLSSITQLNFAGTGIGVSANNLGIAATITVAPPGADNSVLFKDSGDFATSSGLTFDDSTDLLSIGGALDLELLIQVWSVSGPQILHKNFMWSEILDYQAHWLIKVILLVSQVRFL